MVFEVRATHRVTPTGEWACEVYPDVLVDAAGRVLSTNAHITGAAVLDLGQDGEPGLRALTAVASRRSDDVAMSVHGHADRHIDGLVGDLSVANFDVNGVDERPSDTPGRATGRTIRSFRRGPCQ